MRKPIDLAVLLRKAKKTMYAGRSLELLASHAWFGAPDDCRRVVERLEIEHLIHRMKDNGALKCTYNDFVAWGVRRAAVRLAIEQAVALGFVVITRRGYSAKADVRVPSLYRLTFVKSFNDKPPATDEWRRFTSHEQVRVALKNVAADLACERELKREHRELRDRRRVAPKPTSVEKKLREGRALTRAGA